MSMPGAPAAIMLDAMAARPPRPLALVRACHPEPAATVAVLAGALALGAGRGWGSLWVLAAVGAGQLAVGWSNDYLDRDADRRAGRADKPLAAGWIAPRTVALAALAAFAAAVPLSLASGPASAAAHFLALACAVAYNAGLKHRPVSPLPFAVAFGLVPAVVTLGLSPPRPPAAWAMAAGALLGVAGHFTQVLQDIPEDRRRGSRGLPQLLGQRPSGVVAALSLLAAAGLIAFADGSRSPVLTAAFAVAVAGVALILGTVAAGRMRLGFRATLAVAAVTVLALLLGGPRL
jgi:4-hydroxybenzoate polyprenyltransferase